MNTTVVRPRWARVVGATWLVAGAALVLAGLVVLVDQQRAGWELVAGLVALAMGWVHWQRHVVVDTHGIEQAIAWRRTRLVWDVVEDVAVPPPGGLGGPVRLHLAGRGEVVLRATWGLSSRQRADLAEAVDATFRRSG